MIVKNSRYALAVLAVSAPFATPAMAQPRSFNIPSQPASAGIQSFGRQAGVQVLSARRDIVDKRTNAVRGRMEVAEALRQLLGGTGLTARPTGPSTYTVLRAGLMASASYMQDASGASAAPAARAETESSSGDEDIIVTAQKRPETTFEVPIAISVKGGEEIRKRNAQTITDLQYTVPGLSISEFGPGSQRIQFRGVSSGSGLAQIGIYMDEIPLNTEQPDQGPDTRLIDIARVELLRGPQGTLYGQGAMGGTIRYITNDPDPSQASGSALGEVSAIDGGGMDWRGEGVVNVPVVEDRVAVRVAGGYTRLSGWIDNVTTGEERINRGKSYLVRGKLLAKLNEDLTATFMASHQKFSAGANNVADDNQEVEIAGPTLESVRINLFSGVLKYDLGPVTLVSATSWQDRKGVQIADATSSLAPIVELIQGLVPGTIQSFFVDNNNKFRAFSQELRAQYDDGGRFKGIAGVYYRNARSGSQSAERITSSMAFAPGLLSSEQSVGSKSWAVFGDFTYGVLDNLDLSVGLRYFEDQRDFLSTSSTFYAPTRDQGKDTFTAFTPKFNVAWQASDMLNVYATASKGFRSGGFNNTSVGLGLITVPPSYDPDSVWTYELGAKFQTPGNRLTGEVAVFRNVWSDIQALAFAPGQAFSYTVNGAKLAGYGVDAQVSYRPISPLTITLTGGWNSTKYKSTTPEHFEGDRADYAPRYSGSASAEYRFDLASMPSFARIDYQFADGIQVFFRNFQTVPARADTQHFLNFNLGTDVDNWSLQLFVKNILNDYSVTYPAFGSLPYPGRPIPRTFGAQVQTRF